MLRDLGRVSRNENLLVETRGEVIGKQPLLMWVEMSLRFLDCVDCHMLLVSGKTLLAEPSRKIQLVASALAPERKGCIAREIHEPEVVKQLPRVGVACDEFRPVPAVSRRELLHLVVDGGQ